MTALLEKWDAREKSEIRGTHRVKRLSSGYEPEPAFSLYSCVLSPLLCQIKMADVSIAGLQWFILIARLNRTGSRRPSDSHSKTLFTLREKKSLEQESPNCCNPTNNEESSRSSLISVASYYKAQRKAEVLFCTRKKKPNNGGPNGALMVLLDIPDSILSIRLEC